MKKKTKIIIITISCVVIALILSAISFVTSIFVSYNRLGDMDLQVRQNAALQSLEKEKTYSCISYNLGFGAYSQDFTFFLDTGFDEYGNETVGYYSKAKSKDEVYFNINGALKTIEDENVDFAFFQEVDTDSTRSYHINQDEMIMDCFSLYDSVHAINYHSSFMPYPLYDMHGKSNAGLTTISKYQINYAHRKQYSVSTSFSKFFDLDRCFSYSTIQVNNDKMLYLVNSHMSAYDEGGIIRGKQIQELNDFLNERKNCGDYVIVGGDFNHDLLTYNPDYNYDTTNNIIFNNTLKTPTWVSQFFDENHVSPIISGYKVIASDNAPTCRNNDKEWEINKTYVTCVDGFIVSDNIEVTKHYNIITKNGNKNLDGFAFSDHEPTYMEFKLK